MALRKTLIKTITPTATADTTNLVDATYPFLLRGGSSTQVNRIREIYLGGQATVTSPTLMVGALDSTVGTGTNTMGTGQTDAAVHAATAALAAPAIVGNSNATTKPQRSSTLYLHLLNFNAWGGELLREWDIEKAVHIIGASANGGEYSVSAFTGGTSGAMGCEMLYETL